MAIKPLYNIQSPMESARKGLADAGNTMGSMSKGSTTTTEGPGPTAGGAIMAGVGGATAGAALMGGGALATGATVAGVGGATATAAAALTATGWGAIIVGGIALASYFL